MIRRLRIEVSGTRAADGRQSAPLMRLLAVSDETDPALEQPTVRESLGSIDAIVGCGDLDPDYLAMLGDAFVRPLMFVRGNHDRGMGWRAGQDLLPECLPDGRPIRVGSTLMVGLSWPGEEVGAARHDGAAAWRQALPVMMRLAYRGRSSRRDAAPLVMVSHVPPAGVGDVPDDPYHRGFRAYRWLAERARPRIWLHGHSQVAACRTLVEQLGPTTVINVTGAALLELVPAVGIGATRDD